jgi:hypothetical protein
MFALVFALIILQSKTNAQLVMTVNSLADDEYSYAWDDPNTPEDESIDGICEDELGRCTIRAAIDESNNMSQKLTLNFSVSGTINLLDVLYPVNGSEIKGNDQIELIGFHCFELQHDSRISNFHFNNCFQAITAYGNNNTIGPDNFFLNGYNAVIIDGDSNDVFLNHFGIDENDILGPNTAGILLSGYTNLIQHNIICGSYVAGIELSEGAYNDIFSNHIGTTIEGGTGLGNSQGILIAGSGLNTIDNNVVSGNTSVGIAISGVPPDNYSVLNSIENNIIGLDLYENYAIPNKEGIVITNAAWDTGIYNNTIAGNENNGILIFGLDTETETYGTVIQGNRIGLNPNGNIIPNGNGINIWGSVDSVVIGAEPGNGLGDPNEIVGNQGYGISVMTQLGYSPTYVSVRKNQIYQNSTSNLFVSPQANYGIQPPYGLSFNNNTIAGIHDIPGAKIDIYKADLNGGKPSAYQWLGSTTVGGNSVFSYEITDPTVEAVSLVATTALGNSSGFAFLQLLTDVEKENDEIPSEFSLKQNYPNPFNPFTTISFSISNEEFVMLKVFNSLGEEVAELVNEIKPAGNYSVPFNAGQLPSGIYFYKIAAGNFFQTRKMMLVK